MNFFFGKKSTVSCALSVLQITKRIHVQKLLIHAIHCNTNRI
uniref:Uncharacterized protein n=1 Tax=Arundo donax TaxID=35708 RepID=A0A0A9AH95_ARUDO